MWYIWKAECFIGSTAVSSCFRFSLVRRSESSQQAVLPDDRRVSGDCRESSAVFERSCKSMRRVCGQNGIRYKKLKKNHPSVRSCFVFIVISEYLLNLDCVCVFKVELHRICVCVRKRPLNKKGRKLNWFLQEYLLGLRWKIFIIN